MRAVQRRVFPNGRTQFVTPELERQAVTTGQPGVTGDALSNLNARVDALEAQLRTLTGQVEEQGAATREITRSVEQAAGGTAQVASAIGDVSAGARATGAASGQVFTSAQALAREGELLKAEVGKFLASVRAA